MKRRRSAIGAAFASAKRGERAAFVPFLMAGDPDLPVTERLVPALAEAGADVVELGVPFSDPIADGPVNQEAAMRALESGTTLGRILQSVTRIRRDSAVPIVLFSYFNPILRYGVERFAQHAAGSGVDGVLVVDLPPEEARREGFDHLAEAGLDRIFLLAPTSTEERRRAVRAAGSGFAYYVSRTGVTGERSKLPEGLAGEIRAVRRSSKLPVAVGFGISTPEQAAAVGELADGVVVGSALVRLMGEKGSVKERVERVRSRAAAMVEALAGRPR